MSSPELDIFPEERPQKVRIDRIEIRNIKAIDELALEFPPRGLAEDPDIFAFGSRNGVGKTSILEATALLMILAANPGAAKHAPEIFGRALLNYDMPNRRKGAPNVLDLLIRAGCPSASVDARFSIDSGNRSVALNLERSGTAKVSGGTLRDLRSESARPDDDDAVGQFAQLLAGRTTNPLIAPPLLYFHSFRKVQEGSESMTALAEPYGLRGPRFRGESAISLFKQELLRALMQRASLFEMPGRGDQLEVTEKLNSLMSKYAGGRIDKLRPQGDETFDFRVEPLSGGPTYSFDGLSSGQKEVISTLFLIWHFTRNQPSVVLIDEPELHLNPEWHRTFVRDLAATAPNNQYILATHSEEIFATVQASHRALLQPAGR